MRDTGHPGSEARDGAVAHGRDSGPRGGTRPDRLRIALCLQKLEPLLGMLGGEPVSDGTYIVQGYVAAGLRSRGHELSVLAPRNLREVECSADLQVPAVVPRSWSASRWFDVASGAVWRVQQSLGVPYLNVFTNLRHLDAYLHCLVSHDVVYERNALFSLAVARACRWLDLPYVMFFEADQLLELEFLGKPVEGLLRWRAERVLRYNLRAADCVTCVSEPTKNRLMTVWQVPPEKIVVCPNGVDVQRFNRDPGTAAAVRASMGLGDSPVIAFVGSFFEWYDISTLLDAFGQVLATRPEVQLVLVGDGPQRQAMERRAAELGAAHAVTFTGLVPHEEVARLLAAADMAAAVYPRLQHDLWLSPLKLFEYMASGAAIVASATGQVADVIIDGRNGLLVPPGDALALADALRRLVDDPGLRSGLGRCAREDAAAKHSWEGYVRRLELVFQGATARHRGQARARDHGEDSRPQPGASIPQSEAAVQPGSRDAVRQADEAEA